MCYVGHPCLEVKQLLAICMHVESEFATDIEVLLDSVVLY